MRIPANVQRGVAYLDETEPDWRERLDPHTLDLISCRNCVLGQLDGDFEDGLAARGLTYADAERLGFWKRTNQRWPRLTEAWRQVLAS